MADREITARVIALVSVGFVLLVAIQIWLHQTDQPEQTGNQPTFSPTEIKGKEQNLRIGGEDEDRARAVANVDELTREKIQNLREGSVPERRSAALQLTFDPHPAAERALLEGLDDPDRHVAEQCAQALLEVWRSSDSAVASRLLDRALEAYESGRWDAALRHLKDTRRLDPEISEVYRLKARIWMRRDQPDRALKNAKKALSLEKRHFRARYLVARCYARQGEKEKGLQQLEKALEIYPYFEEARNFKKELSSGGSETAQGG